MGHPPLAKTGCLLASQKIQGVFLPAIAFWISNLNSEAKKGKV